MQQTKTLIVAMAAMLAGVSAASAEIKIGITMSASGPGAALGQPQSKTVAALPKEIGGEKITYFALDDESDPTKAAQNARKLLSEEKVDVLIGSSLTPVSLPLIDIAAEAKTPLMTMAAAAILVAPMDERRKWVYKVVPNDDIMAEAIGKYIAKTGAKKVGYIGFSDAYGEGYYKVLAAAAPKLGFELTTHEVYARSDASVTGQVLKIIATKPDAVFIAAAGTPAVLPQKALRERGFKGPIYQTHGVATEEFIKLGGKDVEGAIFTGEAFSGAEDMPADSPFRKVKARFVDAYKAANGGASPTIFGVHLWDSMTLVENAIPGALKVAKPGTPEFRAAIRDQIEKSKDLALNNGLSNMTPDNHNGYDERSAFLIEIRDGAFRLKQQ
ncbi:ABC transporter substrate-binding protein [Rhodopseudomonas telluris]|uniref:ABC transporter substrate-binding protein n=1 Tax=Rhodopseudomonas telluris TaxID=644215 RepID=A0ABV6EL79_9BRAD